MGDSEEESGVAKKMRGFSRVRFSSAFASPVSEKKTKTNKIIYMYRSVYIVERKEIVSHPLSLQP